MRKDCEVAFSAAVWGLSGNVYALHPPRWKAHDRLEHFSLALTAEAPRAEISSSRRIVKRMGHFEAKSWVTGIGYLSTSIRTIR